MKIIYLHVVTAWIPWAIFCTFQCRAGHVKFKYFIVNAIKISLVLKSHIYFVRCSVAKLCPTLCNPMDCSTPASLSFSVSWSLFKLMSIESVMLFNHLILCCPLRLSSTFPNIRVFSNESVLLIWWPKYWSFGFSISPSNYYSWLISFGIYWFDPLAVQGTLKSLL